MLSCFVEVSVQANCFNATKKPVYQSELNKKKTKFLSHKLTQILQLCELSGDEKLFGYFYKHSDSSAYTLHVFYSVKSNLVHYLNHLQTKALQMHIELAANELKAPSHTVLTKKTSANETYKSNNSHLCSECPMVQFGELCEFLNLLEAQQQKSYDVLMYIVENNLSLVDQSYFFECLNDSRLNFEFLVSLENMCDFHVLKTNTIQLVVALIHKVCRLKQSQHAILSRYLFIGYFILTFAK